MSRPIRQIVLCILWIGCGVPALGVAPALVWADAPNTKIILVGQRRDHPPGAHQYLAGLRVLAACLKNVPNLELEIVSADEPWPDGPKRLEAIDGVVLYLGEGGRWIQNDLQRLAAVRRLADGPAGIVAIHWAIGAQDGRYITPYREIIGGIHGGADRRFVVSKNPLSAVSAEHPIMRGVENLTINDEWYYQLKFSSRGQVTPLLAAKIDNHDETVAWAYLRESGGRSFGFSGMHFHENWKNQSLRRMIAQAVLWSVRRDIPESGLTVDVPDAVHALGTDE